MINRMFILSTYSMGLVNKDLLLNIEISLEGKVIRLNHRMLLSLTIEILKVVTIGSYIFISIMTYYLQNYY